MNFSRLNPIRYDNSLYYPQRMKQSSNVAYKGRMYVLKILAFCLANKDTSGVGLLTTKSPKSI